MSRGYKRRHAERETERQRSLMGETLAEFHARERPAPTAPGAGIPKIRCQRTPNLFTGKTDKESRRFNLDLFKEPE